MATRETSYTLTEAAQVTGRSRVTIRRWLDAQRFPHAFRDETSGDNPPPWRIPLTDLVAAGFTVSPADRLSHRPSATQGEHGAVSPVAAVEVQQLREALAVATALADERARMIDVLTDQVNQLRLMLADALATTRATVGR
jgi:hypothetical protein